ncbi:hypothetical protein [uncultured Capnocytophaga sp.]|uniref:hypothetical protein n=1 Tax=uncultured Capnocytophaga sp. TaxID=159273 RepID=UPI002629C93A|nr:hypothetical protein [uncultured Capnocytophaga sp.]
MKYILNIVIGVFMLVLLGCNAKEEPANPHEDPKKEKTREEFIKEKLGIPAEAQITYEAFGVVGYPSYLLAKNKKTFYFYKYDGDYKVLTKHIETLPEDIEFRGEKVGQINTQRIEPILYQKNNIAIGGIRVSFAIVENPSHTSFQYEYYSKKFVLSDEAVKVVDIPYEIQEIEYMEGIGCFITMADNYQWRLLYDTNWNLWGKVPLYFYKYPYSGKKSFAVLNNDKEVIFFEFKNNKLVKKYTAALPEKTDCIAEIKFEKNEILIYLYKNGNKKNYYFKFTGEELMLVNT